MKASFAIKQSIHMGVTALWLLLKQVSVLLTKQANSIWLLDEAASSLSIVRVQHSRSRVMNDMV